MFFNIKIMNLYHYTELKNLQSILVDNGIFLRAHHYSKYRSGDYAWTKKKVRILIKKICLINGYEYDKTDVLDPFILSFSNNGKSSLLWRRFGDFNKGIQLVFDKEIILQKANRECNPDVLMDCIYTNRYRKMRSFLVNEGWKKYPCHSINKIQDDLEEISTFIMKPKFRDENECRYIVPYHKLTHFSNGIIWDENIARGEYVELMFPKEALIGINIGYKSKISIDEVKSFLGIKGYDLSKVNVTIYKP